MRRGEEYSSTSSAGHRKSNFKERKTTFRDVEAVIFVDSPSSDLELRQCFVSLLGTKLEGGPECWKSVWAPLSYVKIPTNSFL